MDTTIIMQKKTAAKKQKLMERVSSLSLNDQGIAFDPSSGVSFRLNGTGLDILRAWQAEKDDAETASLLCDIYGIERSDAVRDILEFRSRLHTLGLMGGSK